jgi:Fe-S cluster biogenesis protein NfuA/predicted RNase H-like HicB family nuclease
MRKYALDYYGFSNEDGDGCMAVFVDFPDIKGVGDTYEEAKIDAYEQLEQYLNNKDREMTGTFDKAIEAYETKQFDVAYGLFEEAAQSNTKAMLNLAMMHMKGTGCAQSDAEAKVWLERAAAEGSSQALYSLAVIYEKGLQGAADSDKALEYYVKAADEGHIEAQLKAGMLYRQNNNISESMRYLITAAHNNHEQAQGIITFVSNASLTTVANRPFRSLDDARQRALVEDMIEKKIRPTLQADNGGINLVNYIPGEIPQIWLNYLGACSGCHLGSTSTADMLLDQFETLVDKNVVLYLM